jgi:phosphoribosyl 1,2-cyclic phosphate phosphodiesterase
MKKRGEERTRTSIALQAAESLLIDCGPDMQRQMVKNDLQRPDAILITHEHADHFLGMDDLLAFRRALPKDAWQPIPVYATDVAWQSIQARFGYLIGTLVERREAVPNKVLDGLKTKITPFKTFHGPSAPGSVGYVVEEKTAAGGLKLVYTSDFMRLDEEPNFVGEPDVLIIQSHWLNEPVNNRPFHMSFQCAMDYIRRWKPKQAVYLVHISAGDCVPGDPANDALHKLEPTAPLANPATGIPYPIPRCQAEWQAVVDMISVDFGLPQPIFVAHDGMARAY